MATDAPRSCNRSAAARPSPRAAPVTIATRPVKSCMEQRSEQRRLVVAVRAPRSEDVDENDLAAKSIVGQRNGFTAQVGKAELKAACGIRQRDVFPTIGDRRVRIACRGPRRMIRIARPVIAG